ncbi:MAG: VWA domain-containing protein [Verrucomicrobiae bacterium]|nr:VWA domain-containing protein [Verrucomicrobiae bacterium]
MSRKSETPAPAVTEIAFILDRSGSMDHLVEAAISGFNQFLRDQQEGDAETEGIARLTLVQFDDQYEVPIDNLPVSEVVSLDTTTYVPRGCTALLDAIGTTIDRFRRRIKDTEKKHQPDKVIFAIFTDGLENASTRYGWMDIARMIRRRREKDGWEFLFLAANQDAIATAAQMNIHARDSATAQFSDQGIESSSRAFSRKIRAMRSSLNASSEAPVHEDLTKPMDEILSEEEERD